LPLFYRVFVPSFLRAIVLSFYRAIVVFGTYSFFCTPFPASVKLYNFVLVLGVPSGYLFMVIFRGLKWLLNRQER